MRIVIIMLIGFISGCNSSDDDSSATTKNQFEESQKQIVMLQHDVLLLKTSLPPNETTSISVLRAKIAEQEQKLAKLQIIGKVHGTSSYTLTRTISQSFGPCPDMGVKVGDEYTSGPLDSLYQAFKQCTGFYYETSVATGELKTANRIYFDGPACTGNAFVWDAGGQGYDRQKLDSGVVFISPADGQTLMVSPGQSPQLIQAQSVFIIQNGICTPDGDLQPMWSVIPNDISVTGIPNSVGDYSLQSP